MTEIRPTQSQKVEAFRALHDREGAFLIANPWDLGSAKILQGTGFEALATTSAGLAWSLGKKDGVPSRKATLDHCRTLAENISVPLSADLGIGFGVSPEEVAETIRLAAATGLAGCSIEDASVRDGKLFDTGLALERIIAAVEAVQNLDHDFVLTARTEGFAFGGGNLDETIERLAAFSKAGADVLFAPGMVNLGMIRMLCETLDKPVNVLTGFRGMNISYEELEEAGVKRVSVGAQLARISYGALMQSAEELFKTGAIKKTDNPVRSSAIGRLSAQEKQVAR